jgi:hypothetical protein
MDMVLPDCRAPRLLPKSAARAGDVDEREKQAQPGSI